MQLISITTLLLGLLSAGALAAPVEKRAAARDFAELTISNGVAGNALAEATAKLPFSTSDLASVTADQLSQLQTERETAEDAETDAFNGAIDAASGDAKTALQNGKIKNKVLKLLFEVTGLQVEQAQGKDVASQITEEQTKLNNNIAIDKKAAGQTSETVTFNGS